MCVELCRHIHDYTEMRLIYLYIDIIYIISTYTHTHTCSWGCKCIYIYIYHICVSMYIYIYRDIHTCTQIKIYTNVHYYRAGAKFFCRNSRLTDWESPGWLVVSVIGIWYWCVWHVGCGKTAIGVYGDATGFYLLGR